MLQRIVLIFVILLILAVIGYGLQMFITQRYQTVAPEDFARNIESLKTQGTAMEQEAIAERLEEELAAARDEAERQRQRVEAYDRLVHEILSESDDSPGNLSLSPGERLLVLKARLDQATDPEAAAEIRQAIAMLQAEVESSPGPVSLRGATARPGLYMPPVDGVMTLSQLLRAAGGIEGDEDAQFSIRVFRMPYDPMHPAFFIVADSLDDIAQGDFDLAPNDVIIVER